MRDLHYDDIMTSRHFIWVATWQSAGEWWVRFGVDAKVGAPQSLGPVEE